MNLQPQYTRSTEGGVIWITGLSGAGKSTLALEVAERLRARSDGIVMLDGDELREVFGAVAAIEPASMNLNQAA